jgi:hypothetical protein
MIEVVDLIQKVVFTLNFWHAQLKTTSLFFQRFFPEVKGVRDNE